MKTFRFLFSIVLVCVVTALVVPATFSIAAESIYVYIDKPKDFVKKTDNLKIQGDIDGLEAGKSYIIRVQVFEDGGTNYSAPVLHSFTVEE